MISPFKFPKENKNYISEPDLLLIKLAKKYPTKSKSQQKEIENYQTIYSERDTEK